MSEISIWKDRISRAQGLQDQQHSDWKDSIKLYNCDYFKDLYSGIDPERVEVNFAKWYIDKQIPLVYFKDPKIFIKNRGDAYGDLCDTLDTLVNYEWRRLRLKKQFKRVILSADLTSPGWLKMGYTAKIGQDIAKIEEIKQKSLISDLKDTIKGIFNKDPEDVTPEEQGILNAYITEENLFATHISSFNVLIPDGYQYIENMPYIIEVEDVPMMDFKENPFFKNKTSIMSSRANQPDNYQHTRVSTGKYSDGTKDSSKDNEIETIKLYHIWDRRNQERKTMSMRTDDWHFKGKWPYDAEGFPLKPLMFEDNIQNEDQCNPYPTNILKPIMSQIIEKSQARTQMVKWRKRATAYILAQEGLATDEDMTKLGNIDGVTLAKVSNIAAFLMTQTTNLPNGVFEVDDLIDKDLQMGTSMGQMMFQAQSGQRTATQASIGQSGLQAKLAANVDTIEDYTVDVASWIAQSAMQFYDKDKVEEILGEPVTEKMWPDFSKMDPAERRRIIKSDIQITIDAGSTAPPKDETADKKQLLDMVSIIMSVAPERIKKGEFVERLLKRFKFAKDLDKIVISSDEDEQKKAMAENELMVAGHPQVPGPNEPHDVHIQEHIKAAGHPLVDQHIVATGQLMGIKPKGDKQGEQQGAPQSGDTRPPKQSTNPEIARQGMPSNASISGQAHNAGPGSKAPL
jgi:uncharacterized protein YeaC (DUF1315 family)